MPNLHKVIVLLVTSRDREMVHKSCIERLGMTDKDAKKIIDKALKQITIAADHDRKTMIGEAVIRFDDIYEKSQRVQDQKTALAAEDKKCRLLALYGHADGEDDAEEATDQRLEAIRSYLEPLELGTDRTPTEELARLAAAELCRLRSELIAVDDVTDEYDNADPDTELEINNAEEESG